MANHQHHVSILALAGITFLVVLGAQWGTGCRNGQREDTSPPALSQVRSAHTNAGEDSWEFVASQARLNEARNVRLNVFVAPFSMAKTVNPSVYVRSPVPFRLRIYRLGWYGSSDAGIPEDEDEFGASLVYDPQEGGSPTLFPAQNHTAEFRCGYVGDGGHISDGGHVSDGGVAAIVEQSDIDFGLVECPWTNPISPSLSTTTSGLYMARVTATIDGVVYNAAANFVLRDDTSTEHLVIVNPTTEQAYNLWTDEELPGPDAGWVTKSFYTSPQASKVSFNRPLAELSGLLKNAYPFLRFLEKENLPYTVATDYDVHIDPTLLNNRKSIVVVGHGEYWSSTTRVRLDQAVHAGKNLIALAANTGYWQIRYEASPAGMPSPVVVGHKDLALTNITPCTGLIVPDGGSCADPVLTDTDPLNDRSVTTYFRHPAVGWPEQLLLGVQYQFEPKANIWELPVTLFTDVLSSLTSTRTGISDGGRITVGVADPNDASHLLGNIGHEGDVLHPQILMLMNPGACLKVLAEAPWHQEVEGGPLPSEAGNYVAHLVLYRPTSTSGYVFGGFSMLWSWGVDDWAATHGFGYAPPSRVDPKLITLTRNMLNAAEADVSVRPTTC